jgi:thioredoxin-dependent peroxiredoxin
MEAYRSRYAELQSAKTQVLAVSMDDAETLKRFKDSLKAPFPFVSDPKGALIDRFDVRGAVFTKVARTTFVIGKDRKILEVQSGSSAIDPSAAITACALPPSKATAAPDGGTALP